MKILGAECSAIPYREYDSASRSLKRQWQGWHSARSAFNRWNDERNVNVNRNNNDWNDHWFFAGVRNSLHSSAAP